MTVYDVISACEFTGCIVVDQLCDEIKVTKENSEEIYQKEVERIDAANDLVRIWTFDKINEVEGLTEKDFEKYVPADRKWDSLMNAVLRRIRDELDRLYWNKHQEKMESPFDNTGAEYSNDVFSVRAYNWDDDAEEKPNFECGPIKVYWYKHEGRGNTIKTKMGYDTPAIYAIMLEKCIEALRKDFGEEEE